MSIQEWQQRIHARNVQKGFYDYEQDIRLVSDLLDRCYRAAMIEGLATIGDEPVKAEISLSEYWALARIVKDYERSMIERKMLLIIGEIIEAHEELRNNHAPSEVYFKPESPKKPEGFPIEMADAQIRLLDLMEALKLSTEFYVEMKHEFNETREHRHGRQF